jgi:hypothetical protein
MSVTLCLYGYSGDIERLYRNVDAIQRAHNYSFEETLIIHQECKTVPVDFDIPHGAVRKLYTEDYRGILKDFNIDIEDPKYLKVYDGNNQHWWFPKHLVSQLIGLSEAKGDYVVFNDSDCIMVRNKEPGWIDVGIDVLKSDPKCLVVSPCDGAPGNTQIMSQQFWLCERERVKNIDWNCWNGTYIDGGPMSCYYALAEGRIGMYMYYNDLHRTVLPEDWRYYHNIWQHKVPEDLWKIARGLLRD